MWRRARSAAISVENRGGRLQEPAPHDDRGRRATKRTRRRRSGPAARSRSNLVVTGTAVDRPVVPRGERHDSLSPAHGADCGVVLARSPGRPCISGRLPATRTPLGVVLQPLRGEERLLARGKDELHSAVPTGKDPILVHLLCWPSSTGDAWARRFGPRPVVVTGGGRAPGRSDSQSLGSARLYARRQARRNGPLSTAMLRRNRARIAPNRHRRRNASVAS
jgi:hypothetical protein